MRIAAITGIVAAMIPQLPLPWFIDINEILIQGNCSWNEEDCREEEKLADDVQNTRLRIPPQEELGPVRRRRTCPEVQERQHDEQDATRHECSST
jgi:hypothetical protein